MHAYMHALPNMHAYTSCTYTYSLFCIFVMYFLVAHHCMHTCVHAYMHAYLLHPCTFSHHARSHAHIHLVNSIFRHIYVVYGCIFIMLNFVLLHLFITRIQHAHYARSHAFTGHRHALFILHARNTTCTHTCIHVILFLACFHTNMSLHYVCVLSPRLEPPDPMSSAVHCRRLGHCK
jgi:hypothetical protein